MHTRFSVVALCLSVFACSADDPGTLITNVRIVDGTGAAARDADVRIVGDRIFAIGQLEATSGDRVIDGEGLVLAPGFIDAHSHHDGGIHEDRPMLAVVNQGVTTVVVGQDGGHNFPLYEFFGRLQRLPVAVNVASLAGHGRIRSQVMGDDYKRAATDDEIRQMVELLRVELEAGALGLSSGLEYDPGSFAETSEIIELAKEAASAGGVYQSHIRSEDQYFWEAVEEVADIGRAANLPVKVTHIKLAMPRFWGQTDRLLNRLDELRESGVDISADIYPYEAWQTGFQWLATLFPERDLDRRDGAEYILNEMLRPEGIVVYNHVEDGVHGKSVADVAAERGIDHATALMDLLKADAAAIAEGGQGAGMLGYAMRDEDIGEIMAWPHTVICSDGELNGPHPRGYGTFPRVLGHYVRDMGAMTLEEAVHKMTGLTAQHLGIAQRGLIEEGYYADLVLFDPETIRDRAVATDPHVVAEGVHRVWVNGHEVYRDGRSSPSFPGQLVLRQ